MRDVRLDVVPVAVLRVLEVLVPVPDVPSLEVLVPLALDVLVLVLDLPVLDVVLDVVLVGVLDGVDLLPPLDLPTVEPYSTASHMHAKSSAKKSTRRRQPHTAPLCNNCHLENPVKTRKNKVC